MGGVEEICRRLPCAGRLGPEIQMHTVVSRTVLVSFRKVVQPRLPVFEKLFAVGGGGVGGGVVLYQWLRFLGEAVTRVKS